MLKASMSGNKILLENQKLVNGQRPKELVEVTSII